MIDATSSRSLPIRAVGGLLREYRTLILLLLWLGLFLPVYPALFRDYFSDPDTSHGLLVPLIALYLVWLQRQRLRTLVPRPSTPGFWLLVASLLGYLLGLAGGILVLQRSMMVLSFIGLVLYLLGPEVFRLLAFPLFFLFFLVPLPVSIVSLVAFPLQLLATKVAEQVIQLVGIPVYREGNMLYFLHTQLEVAEACSGIRSLMAMTMLGTLFVYFSDRGWWRRGILLLSAIPIAVFANILRVSGTGIMAHYFGGEVARGFLHEFSGMVVFALGFLLLYLEARLLKWVFPGRRRGDRRDA